MPSERPVLVVGAGLAGCEVALQLARRGVPVRLCEMKPKKRTPAQVSDHYAELVCSNSFRSASLDNAVGVIKEEMRLAGGHLIRFADEARVPAGSALAVDRDRFSAAITRAKRARTRVGVMFLDLDHFKDVNDRYGHLCGDAVLAAVGIARRVEVRRH